MKPTLTPEEWADEGLELFDGLVDLSEGILDQHIGTAKGSRDRQALAALLLHGQPFGFTWDDVDAIHEVRRGSEELRLLADRIAALLPPR